MAVVSKADLIELIRRKAIKVYNKNEVEDIYDSLCEVIMDEVKQGNVISLLGVGRFELGTRAGHIGRNPRTGEEIEIPEKVHIAFRVSKRLRDEAASLDPNYFRREDRRPQAQTRRTTTKPDKPRTARRSR